MKPSRVVNREFKNSKTGSLAADGIQFL